MEILTHATHVNDWEPAVYMSCTSQNFRLLHTSKSSVRNFRFFLLMYPGSGTPRRSSLRAPLAPSSSAADGLGSVRPAPVRSPPPRPAPAPQTMVTRSTQPIPLTRPALTDAVTELTSWHLMTQDAPLVLTHDWHMTGPLTSWQVNTRQTTDKADTVARLTFG